MADKVPSSRYNFNKRDDVELLEDILGKVSTNSSSEVIDDRSGLFDKSKITKNKIPNTIADISMVDYDEEPFANVSLLSASMDNRKSFFQGFGEDYKNREKFILEMDEFATNKEVADIISKMASSMITYEPNSPYFCKFNEKAIEKDDNIEKGLKSTITENAKKYFTEVYSMMGFNKSVLNEENGGTIHRILTEWFKYGRCAYYMVFDDIKEPTKIVNIIKLDMKRGYLVPKIHRSADGIQYKYWIYRKYDSTKRRLQYKRRVNQGRDNLMQKDITILDSQLVQIGWNEFDETYMSYIQGFQRSFNMFRSMEKTMLTWAINNSIQRIFYTVPVKGKGANKALNTVTETMQRYMNPISFSDRDGVVTVGSSVGGNQMNQEVFMGETSSGKPEMETVDPQGHDMQNTQPTEYFKRKYQSESYMPRNRFDEDNPEVWTMSPESITNQESQFEGILEILRGLFSRLILKPVWYMLIFQDREKFDNEKVRDSLSLEFYSVNLFLQNAQHELLQKQIGLANDIYETEMIEVDGIEVSRWSKSWLFEQLVTIWDKDDMKRNNEQVFKDLKERSKFTKKVKEILKDEIQDMEDNQGF